MKLSKKAKQYIITAAVGAAITIIVIACEGIFTKTEALAVFQCLCDGFFVAGALLLGSGVLVFASNGGAFDMLAYGGIKFIDRFRKNVINQRYHTFYDYREAQKEKNRSFLFMVVVGAAYLAVAVIFLVLFKTSLK